MTKRAVIPAKAGIQMFVILSEAKDLVFREIKINDRNQKNIANPESPLARGNSHRWPLCLSRPFK